ncbi:hypothetical protein CALCODRAFT_553581 [Calocera cornea HHB12733]|uniref:F-box domain-containing protein n=1 Tax=Calocera cornea HHB12733 TaxID=1353952 RepID=A0A165IK53_9BASI|nr:hypothetical protein CALCODRAFT_553581 [Calocera cornea HHB12733]
MDLLVWSVPSEQTEPEPNIFSACTRHPPTFEEEETEDRMKHLTAYINSLRYSLDTAQKALEAEGRALFRLRAKRAPISFVPNDILRHIFILGSDQPLSVHRSRRAGGMHFQETVSQVCFRWRQVAISTAALWTDWELFSPPDPLHSIIDIWLHRSASAPLSLSIDAVRPKAIANQAVYGSVLQRVAERLVSLSIHAHDSTCVNFLSPLGAHLQWLRRITLSCPEQIWRPNGPFDLSNYKNIHLNIPQLTDLHLRHCYKLRRMFSFEHLTELVIINEGVEVVLGESIPLLQTLPPCLSLRRLRLAGYCFQQIHEDDNRSAVYSFPKLEQLELEEEQSPDQYIWLMRCDFPALKRLVLGPGPLGPFQAAGIAAQRAAAKSVFFERLKYVAYLALAYPADGHECTIADLAHTLHLVQEGLLPSLEDLILAFTSGSLQWPLGINRGVERIQRARGVSIVFGMARLTSVGLGGFSVLEIPGSLQRPEARAADREGEDQTMGVNREESELA